MKSISYLCKKFFIYKNINKLTQNIKDFDTTLNLITVDNVIMNFFKELESIRFKIK